MKISKLNFLILSLPAVAMSFPYSKAHAALRINNSSLIQAQAQAQNSAARSAVQTYEPQPALVITNDNGETTSISTAQMDSCNAIYPGGVFDWVKPTTGMQRGGPATCAALVELRSYKNTDYTVLASAYLASGDGTKCNVDNFHNFTPAGRDFTYPADSAPTIADVEKVMAAEQKANAGIKILAAAVVGGIGGNLTGKGDAGDDSPLGTSKEKMKNTALGALGGAALMTASTQSNDYKVGSTIMSTGINAAAGAVAGNLMASGDDILKIEKCTIKNDEGKDGAAMDKTCLYGTYDLGVSDTTSGTVEENVFYDVENHEAYECTPNKDGGWDGCRRVSLTKITFEDVDDPLCKPAQGVSNDCIKALENSSSKYKYDNGTISTTDSGRKFVKIKSATKVGRRVVAMIVFTEKQGEKQGAFGIKHSEWLAKYSGKFNNNNLIIYDPQGSRLKDASGKEIKQFNIDNFYPSAQSADDGDVVDFNNRARTKSTLIGAGGGAALGALSGVSGAESEIQNRWAAAVREYEDSLTNVMCVTGTRFLAKYNDAIIIPAMTTVSE